MTRLITKAALLSACGMLVAAAAMAGVPDAGTSTSPGFLRLGVTTPGGIPDSVGCKFTVTVLDLSNAPIVGSNVVVDFSACTPLDIKIAADQRNTNYTVDCTGKAVSAYTHAGGVVAFTLLGNSFSTLSHTGLSCARIHADGVLLSSPSVATYDNDGASGISAGDLSVWLSDLGAFSAVTPVFRGRADLDGNHAIGAGDLSVWLAGQGRFAVSGSSSSVAC